MPTSENNLDPIEALSEIAQTINSILELQPLLEKIIDIALDVLAAERGLVLLKNTSAPNGFEIETSRNLSANQLVDITQLSSSVIQNVLKNGESILLYEAQKDPQFSATESIVIQKIQSIACVPLKIKNRQIGAIYLDSLSHRSRFTKENLPFLTAFANQAAVAIENARLYEGLRSENRQLRDEVQRTYGFEGIIGRSRAMQKVFELITRVLDSDVSVLIEGESGTGKELVARAIHYSGHRKDKPFMAFFCGSLPDSLLESELFGHKKGAFTGAATDKRGLFEAVDKGTFFLDEIGDLSPNVQTKLLRVLQEGEIKRVGETQIRKLNVRIISATNRVLTELVAEQAFREDLYYRLNTITITLPPLRERKTDIPLLAHHFLDKYTKGRKTDLKGFDAGAIDALTSHSWPGNVRELENTIERAIVLARAQMITSEDLHLQSSGGDEPLESGITLKEIERRAVKNALDAQDGNISATAEALGVSRRWLHYKVKEWQL